LGALFFLEKLWRRPDLAQCDYIFFGLGNPGKKYANTRHNIGFRVLDSLARKNGIVCRAPFGKAAVGVGTVAGKKVALVKPLTFVNNSGLALVRVLDRAGTGADRVVVVVDDFNMNLGTLRLRRGGSHGGHNGLKSCIAVLGEDFPRLRVGVGPAAAGMSVIDFVLGDFSNAEKTAAASAVERAGEALTYLCATGFDAAMNVYNKGREKAGSGGNAGSSPL
jgi:PTH1 family peptidyl-tRNA hydrolase